MKIRLAPIAILAVLALLVLGSLGQFSGAENASAAPPGRAALGANPQACSGGISGAVFASDTDLPLAGVTVTAALIGADFTKSATTDAAGRYSIVGLSSGTYQVQFEPDPDTQEAYLSEYFNNQHGAPNATVVAVGAGAITPNINAALDIGGTISGKVIGADSGTELSDVVVEVYNGDDELLGSTLTDELGDYTTGALPTGSYKLRFLAPDGEPIYLSEVYNNKVDLSGATRVGVTAPEDTPGIDVALELGGWIRGKVTAADGGVGLPGVAVDVYNGAGDIVASTTTDESGDYATSGLRSGNYKLLFDPSVSDSSNAYLASFYNNKPDLGSATSVSVGVPNATTANIVLSKGGQFAGTVAGGGQPLPEVEVRVYTGAGEFVSSALSGENGAYITPGLAPGAYKLLFDPSGSGAADGYAFEYYSSQATLSAADLLAAPSPSAPMQINAVLEPGGKISGNVTLDGVDQCGVALGGAGVQITIYNADDRQVAFAETDAAGNYVTPALPSGVYRVGFEAPDGLGFNRSYYNNQLSLSKATPIGVTSPNTTPNIDATLIRGGKLYLPLMIR